MTLATPPSSLGNRFRLWLMSLLLLMGLGFLLWKAAVLQIQDSLHSKEMGEKMYSGIKKMQAPRGRIYAQTGFSKASELELLADSEILYTIHIYPRLFKDKFPSDEVIQRWGELLKKPSAVEIKKLLLSGRSFAVLKRGLSKEEKEQFQHLIAGYKGFDILPFFKRRYPHKELAGPILGWVNIDYVGIEGLEYYYEHKDRQLPGEKQELQTLRVGGERWMFPPDNDEVLPHPGNDLILTVQERLQTELESALQKGFEETHARSAVAIAMDPFTGAILAIASVPTIDPNQPGEAVSLGVRNRGITDPIEPGSTMKLFSMGAALEANITHPHEEWDCENGQWFLPNHPDLQPIRDADHHGVLSTTQVIARSSNICISKITRELGREKLYKFLTNLGFGKPTGVDMTGENAGKLLPISKWDDMTFANISFGQGMTATPLQVVTATAVYANGGILYKPFIVKTIRAADGEIVRETVPEGRRVMRPETAQMVAKMMRAVMEKKGTGSRQDLTDYPIAGKTGTAQRVNPYTHKYDPDQWFASFVGFAPYKHPKIVLGVFLDLQETPLYHGATTAGPIFQEAMQKMLISMGVPPDPIPLEESKPLRKRNPL